MGGNQIRNIAAGTANGQAVIFQQAIKRNDAAGGDLGGTYPNPLIANLQGNRVQAGSPNTGDALVWNGTAWTPQSQQTPQNDPFLILPLATVTRIDNAYEVWFNIDAPGNLAEIKTLNTENLKIFDETDSPQPFLADVRFTTRRFIRNVFIVSLVLQNQPEPNFMRFDFDVNKTIVSIRNNDFTLLDYAQQNNIKFSGYFKGDLATVFVRGSGQRQ